MYVRISVVGGLISGLICIENVDLKVIIAFSSVFHIIGSLWLVFIGNVGVLWGVVLILIFHGLISSGLFVLVGVVRVELGSRNLILMIGVMGVLRFLGVVVFVLLFINIGFPISFGFLGEIEIFKSMGVYYVGGVIVIVFIIFSCVYNMFLYTNLV